MAIATTMPGGAARPTTRWAGWAQALLAAAMSGSLLASSYSLHPLWWAAWLAPVPMLAAILSGPPGRGRWLGMIAGLCTGATTLPYYLIVMPLPIALALVGARGLLWGGAMAVTERAARRLPAPIAVFALPLYAAGLETLILTLSPHGSAGSLAYSQMAMLPVIQVAALGGVPAIVFLVMTGGSLAGFLVARLTGRFSTPHTLRRATLAAGSVIAASLAYGTARLHLAPTGQTAQVSLIATDQFDGEAGDWPTLWRVYAPAIARAAHPGTILVLPEKILRAADATTAETQLAATAQATGATLLAGIETRDAAGRWVNRALLATPDGMLRRYDKQRLVPGLEARDHPGHTDLLAHLAGIRTGIAICKDMHFPDLGRSYGKAGAALMLVPAWDFDQDGWLSDRLTSLRGVESGYAIARTARNGISSASDRYGRILADMTSTNQVTTLTALIPIDPTPTLYDHLGNTFGWCALAAMAWMRLIGRERKARPGALPLDPSWGLRPQTPYK